MKAEQKRLLNKAYGLSMLNLALHGMSLTELYLSHTAEETGTRLEQRILDTASLVRSHFSKAEAVSYETVEALRSDNVSDMEELTALTDVFQTDEYVLNRMEYRFREREVPIYDDGDLTDRLIGFFSSIPADIQNEEILRVIEQLPFRLTKNRFLELIKERLTIYKGGDLSSFTGRLSMLKTACGAHRTDRFSLMDIPADHILSSRETTVETKEEFEALSDSLTASGTLLNIRMDLTSALQEVLNSFETVLLTKDHAGSFELEEQVCALVLKLCDVIAHPEKDGPQALYPEFEALEGWPETYSEEVSGLFSQVFDDVLLQQVSILMSSSIFTLLDRQDAESVLTEEAFREHCRAFTEAVLERLGAVNRTYARALMARMNAMIPPRFTSQEELENYILNALAGCSNAAEKAGVTEILEEIMKEGRA